MYEILLEALYYHLHSHSLLIFSVGLGDSHYRWGNQLLLPHHAIFMKHLANGLEVNISFTDKKLTSRIELQRELL